MSEAEVLQHLPAESALVHFETCVRIENKEKKLVRARANVFQRRLYAAYETLLPIAQATGLQIRILGLKIRQCGGTTASAHIVYHHSCRYSTDSVVLANVTANSKEMLRKIKLYADNDVFPWNNRMTPLATILSWQNGSRSEISSAETMNVGISRTRQAGLFSEACKYPRGGVKDDKSIMASVLPSLSGQGTIAIAESTPEGACYDPETEVLTDQGWKFFADLNGSESILTKDPKTNLAYYQREWTHQAHWHDGEMVHFKNRSIDVVVTPNHRMWVACSAGKMKFKEASTLTNTADYFFDTGFDWDRSDVASFQLPEHSFPKGAGRETRPAKIVPMDVWLTFLGYWLADGGVMYRSRIALGRKLRRNTVYLTQTKFVDEFRQACLNLAPYIVGKVKEVSHVRGKRWIIEDAQLAAYLSQFSQPKSIPRDLLMTLSKRQCRLLMDAIYLGDGDLDRRDNYGCVTGKIYVGIDKELQDDVMELALKCGYSTTRTGPPRNRRASYCEVVRSKLTYLTPPSIESDYKGMVYCVTLPKHHLLMVRRKTGKALWCGNSGWFYEQYHGTKDMTGAMNLDDYLAALGRGESSPGNGWVKVFAAWFEFEDNVKQVSKSEGERILRTLTPRELNGQQRYAWTVEQIAWRRATLKSECGGSEELFDEYYPEDDITCFLSSGRPRFNMGALVRMQQLARSYKWEEGTLDMQTNGMVTFAQNTGGFAPVRILERPIPGCRYIVWCDPATGEDQTESKDPDRHSIGVLRVGYTMGEVAQPDRVVARIRPPYTGEADVTARHIEALSKYYGGAMVVLEVNMGLHILEHLKARGVPLYRREVIDPYDKDAQRYMFGWKLKDRDQRRTVVDSLAIAIRDGSIDLACDHIIAECMTFVINKQGREEARSGTHDDDVMGLSMAVYCKGAATLYQGQTRKRKKPADWRDWNRG